jgi:hypothetical protein
MKTDLLAVTTRFIPATNFRGPRILLETFDWVHQKMTTLTKQQRKDMITSKTAKELENFVENTAEWLQDRLDREFMKTDMNQAQYDEASGLIKKWVKDQYSAIEILRTTERLSEYTALCHR